MHDLASELGLRGPVLLSGLIGTIVGALLAGRYMLWQTREAARHELRRIVLQMATHAHQGVGMSVGGEYHRTDPWSVYMADALAAYYRYRALLPGRRWRDLDAHWTRFQGTRPQGDTPLSYIPMNGSKEFVDRCYAFLATIK